MKFLCLGFIDEAEWNSKTDDERAEIISNCTNYGDELKRKGHFIGDQALLGVEGTRTLRKTAGDTFSTDGPYLETKELIGGTLHLEARDLDEAEELIRNHPGLDVGPFEIRSIQMTSAAPSIEIQRMISAPPETVFAYWTQAEKLREWWGPRTGRTNWTTPTVEIEPREGGSFRTCIRSPEGQDYWACGTFSEVNEPNRLVFTHQWEGQEEVKRFAVDLTKVGQQTRIRLQARGYHSEESRDGEIEGWHQCLDRLFECMEENRDEALVRGLVADWSRSVAAKNAEEMMKNYSENVVLYDAVPPYKTVGKDAVKTAWECCFPWLPEKCGSEHRDLQFRVSGDLAVVHGLHRFLPEPEGHPCGNSYVRMTIVFQRQESGWLVVHEHVSNPFNPLDDKVWAIKDPEVLDTPDYSACAPKEEVTS